MNKNFRHFALLTGLAMCVTVGGIEGQAQGLQGRGIRVLKGNRYGMTASQPRGVQKQAGQANCAVGSRFVDANQDGVCDLQGQCASGNSNFQDANNDGVCDRMGMGFGRGQGKRGNLMGGQANFIDANGDGVCDRAGTQCGMSRGLGRGFTDANADGINDNSLVAKLNLTEEQKEKIRALRQAGPGPHRDQFNTVLTPEQLAELQTLQTARQAERPAQYQNQSPRQGRGPRGFRNRN